MKKLTIGILAHVDSGKTTLSEAMLLQTGAIRKAGRVDHGDAFLDGYEMERNRGITIFSKQALLEWEDVSATILDTPGHVDFSAEMERTLSVLDYGILVISASEGIQSHTRTLWKLLRRSGIPTFLFINKMDLSLKKPEEIMTLLRKELGAGLIDFTPGRSEEARMDDLSMAEDRFLEMALEGKLPDNQQIAEAVRNRRIFPCYFGSALKFDGIGDFLQGLAAYTTAPPPQEDFGARIFKVTRDEQKERLTFMKVTGGTLHVKDRLTGTDRDGNEWSEKVNQIRIYSGMKYTTPGQASQGTVLAVTGLTRTLPGDVLGAESAGKEEVLEPFLNYRIILPPEVDVHRGLRDMRELAEEDPKLNVTWNEESGEIGIRMMGEVQLEILQALTKQRFGYEITFGAGKILYRETLAEPTEGIGHFEPLRHYAEVHLVMEPAERGSGITLETRVPEDELARNWQRLILTHLGERQFPGVLTGAPLTDVKITLTAGRAHKKHTEGGDFRQATYRAVRCGLMRGNCTLLEPWFDFVLRVPTGNIGRAMTDIRNMGGSFGEPENDRTGSGDMVTLRGRSPASEMMDYQARVTAYTKGKGTLSCSLGGYEACHNQEEVVSASGYDPEADLAFPPDSVFCTHGESGIVKWYDIEDWMHLPLTLTRDDGEEGDGEAERAAEERMASYRRDMASDDELMAIFERTYGKVKRPAVGPDRRKPAGSSPGSSFGREKYRGRNRTAGTGASPEDTWVVVDGYNVMFGWDSLKELTKSNYEAARSRLVERMCNYAGFTRYHVILVFDAYKVGGGRGSSERFHNIDIIYTKEEQTADSYIERCTLELRRENRNAGIRVVSSDSNVQQISLGHGALRVSSREFEREVTNVEETIRRIIRG